MYERQHCPNSHGATTSGSPRTGFYLAQSSDCVRAVGNHVPSLGLPVSCPVTSTFKVLKAWSCSSGLGTIYLLLGNRVRSWEALTIRVLAWTRVALEDQVLLPEALPLNLVYRTSEPHAPGLDGVRMLHVGA